MANTNQHAPTDSASSVQLASAQIIRLPNALTEKVSQQRGRIPKHIPRFSDAQRVRQARLDAQWRIQHRLNQIAMYQRIVRESENYLVSTRAWLAHLIDTPIREVLHAEN